MKLISNWKECWKMTSFQLAIVVILLEWGTNLFVSMPDTPQAWALSVSVLVLPVARLWKQTSLTKSS